MASALREDVAFPSGDDQIGAWWYPGGSGRRSCVVMAHGFGGTKRCGLEPFAERFAAAGHHVLVVDYRHVGDSGGQPRQLVDPRRQVDDILSSLRYARARDDVDAARIALWGTSFGGGNVVEAAVRDTHVAAVVSQCPVLDGWTALARALTQPGQSTATRLRVTGKVLSDLAAAALGRDPVLVPLVGPPGSTAAMTAADSEPGYRRIAGPDWDNAVAARVVLALLRHRPVRSAGRLTCPWLVQICQRDTVAPTSSAEEAARRAASWSDVRRYDVEHFGLYDGAGFEQSVADQLAFLGEHLAPAADPR